MKKERILIVGAGKGGTALLNMFKEFPLLDIIGVVDINMDAEGIKLARSLGIRTSTNYNEFLKEDLDVVINVTGRFEVHKDLQAKLKGRAVTIIDGMSAKFLWSVLDERQRVFKELELSRERFDALIKGMDAYIYAVDFHTYEIVYVNDKIKEIVGDVEGKICWQVFQKDQKGPCPFCTTHLLIDEEGKPKGVVVWEHYNELLGRWLECRDQLVRWPDGRLVRMEVAVDITDRKMFEEKLKKSEKRFKDLAELLPDIVLEIDTQGRIIYANRIALEKMSYTKEDIDRGINLEDLVDPYYRNIVRNIIEHPLEKRYVPVEIELRKSNGENFWVEFIYDVIFEENKLIGIRGVARDITVRKKLEEGLLRESNLNSTFAEISGLLISSFSLEELSNLILQKSLQLTNSESGCVGYIDFEKNVLVCPARTEDVYEDIKIAQEESLEEVCALIKWVIDNKRVLMINDFSLQSPIKKQEGARFKVEKFLSVPAQVGNVVFGVIAVANTKSSYSQDDLEVMKRLGQLLGLALQRRYIEEEMKKFNRRLEEMVKNRTQELEVLYEFSQKIPTVFNWSKFFHLSFSYLYQAIKYDMVSCFVIIDNVPRVFVGKTSYFSDSIVDSLIENMNKIKTHHFSGATDKITKDMLEFIEIDNLTSTFSNINSCIHLPLRLDSKIKGFICLCFEEEKILDENELRFFDTLMHQISISLERLEVLIKTRERELSSIIDNLPEGIIIIDEDKKLILFNPQARNILSPFISLEKGNMLNKIIDLDIEEILKKENQICETQVNFPKKLILEAMATSLERGLFGRKGWIILLRDVTQQREKESYINQQQRLATVGQLAGGIAHEFNNILNIMMVITDLVLSIEKNISEESRNWLKNIKIQGRRAANLVRQILDFSRISITQKRPFDLLPFLKEWTKLLTRTLPENIRIILEIENEKDSYNILGDVFLIEQIIMNLAANSRDAMPEGGKLYIRLRKLEVDEGKLPPLSIMPKGRYVVLEVEDTGCGMSEEVKRHAFEPFFTTKEVGKGSGLGLSQVYGIVEQHRGFIKLDSKLNEGTKVTIFFPECVQKDLVESVKDTESKEYVEGEGEGILVVEDEIGVLKLFKESLSRFKYKVFTASNGKEALQIYQKNKDEIDLIIVDVIMPYMDGIKLSEEILKDNPDIKIILMSGYAPPKKIEELSQRKNVIFVSKPIDFEKLVLKIKEFIKKS